jgi:hypothetical protein
LAFFAQPAAERVDTRRAMQNIVLLYPHDDEVARVAVGDAGIEVGSSPDADLIVPDPEVEPRALLVQARGGTVWVTRLGTGSREPRVLPYDQPISLGAAHSLRRISVDAPRRCRFSASPATKRLDDDPGLVSSWTLLLGRGAGVRRITLGDRPLWVGTACDNDVVVDDRTVSAHHCRLEPEGGVLVVRDLGSTNGTYVRGLKVKAVRLGAGAQIRIGRTDLRVIACRRAQGDASKNLIAASPAMQALLSEAEQFAGLSWPVLVLGPSGAGKEEIAGALHRLSPRASRPFVALNAGGLPRDLIESELFGHERGAFTGAVGQRRGAFEQAHGGTLFLDEIGELPLDMQTRLLRVLETWQIRRVGAEGSVAVDVRLVCATHRNLAAMVRSGSFRQDLYYRLARLVVRVPPLSERPEDIDALATHFLGQLESELGVRALTEAARKRLKLYPWPGNARELRNVIHAAAAASAAPVLDVADIVGAVERIAGPLTERLPDSIAAERVVAAYGGNLSAASRALSIPRSTLRDRLRRERDSAEA